MRLSGKVLLTHIRLLKTEGIKNNPDVSLLIKASWEWKEWQSFIDS